MANPVRFQGLMLAGKDTVWWCGHSHELERTAFDCAIRHARHGGMRRLLDAGYLSVTVTVEEF